MINITIFEAFVITHLFADWIFQTNWEAKNKDKKLLPLLVHSSVYALSFIPAFYFYGVNFLWLFLLFVTHAIIDQRKLELWFLKIKGNKEQNATDPKFVNLVMGLDQAMHLIILAVIALLS